MFRNSQTGVIIVIYVDNLLVIAKLLSSIFDIAELINAAFLIRALGELYYYLGMRVIRNRQQRQLIVVQDAYIDKIARKFNLTATSSIATLLGKTLATRLYAALEGYVATNKLKTKY